MDWDRKFQFTKNKLYYHSSHGTRDSIATNDKTFTVTRTQVSAHYVIADDEARSTNVE
jgi:N-acetyl-anhydromuramyl-L-alanine amidase AmpD